jgi:enamine deaminase RidA (YjgF/YER057c/UK114 family)
MNIELRSSSRGADRECHVTGSAEAPVAADGLRAVFEDVAAARAREAIEPIEEKVYGPADARTAILRARAEALRARGLDASTPVTFVSGAPACGGSLAGVHLWGVANGGSGTTVRTVPAGRAAAGRLWSTRSFRLLHLPGVVGVTAADTLPATAGQQAQQMFQNASAAAAANGFRYGQTVRTWIYVARLLDWYGELNRIRSDFYATQSFACPAFPASTGIQGRAGGEECLMDLLLLDAGDSSTARATAIDRTSRQGPACSYGSLFSRGMVLDLAGQRTVHVSGTASIGPDGRSLHAGEPLAQCRETLLGVGAVLEQQGGTLADVSSATVFCKDADTYAAFRQQRSVLGVAPFPTVYVIADVCRPELLVEMEAVASL